MAFESVNVNSIIMLDIAVRDQNKLTKNVAEFNSETKPETNVSKTSS